MKHILIMLTTSSVLPLQFLFANPLLGLWIMSGGRVQCSIASYLPPPGHIITPPPPTPRWVTLSPLLPLFFPLYDHYRTHFLSGTFLILKIFFLTLHMALSHIHTFIVYAQSVVFPNPSPNLYPSLTYYHLCTHLISETFVLKIFVLSLHIASSSFLFRSISWFYVFHSDDLFLKIHPKKELQTHRD